MTSIYNNRVTLSVEDKPIAKGELVIVNDRYGVKIDEVIAKGHQAKSQATEVIEENQQEENADNLEENDNFEEDMQDENNEVQNENSEEDEFDYSDFELEDEDI